MKIRYFYEFSFGSKPIVVWEIEHPLTLNVGQVVHMKELGGQVTIRKVEHHLETLAGVAVCRTCIDCG